MPKFKDEIIGGKRIRCTNENEAIALLKWVASKGIKWNGGQDPANYTLWEETNGTIYYTVSHYGLSRSSLGGDDFITYKETLDA